MKAFTRNMLGLAGLATVLSAGAQVVPVQPAAAGGIGWPVILVVIGALVVAAVLYMRKHGQHVAASTALDDAKALLQAERARLDKLVAGLAVKTPATAAPGAGAQQSGASTQAPPGGGVGGQYVVVPKPPEPVAAPAPAPAMTPEAALSNAPNGYPRTSPAGYTLWYALGGDGKPVGAPAVLYDGNTFPNDAAVGFYQAAVATRALNLAAYQTPAFVGTMPMSTLTPADWCYIDSRGNVNWNAVLNGDADVFKAQTVHFYYNGLASFDPATYNGPLKQYG